MSESNSPVQSDTVRALAKSGAVLFVGMVAELGIAFVAKLLIARYLGRVEYGAVALGVTMLMVAVTLALLGLNIGVSRYLPRAESTSERRDVLVASLQLSGPIAILIGGGLVIWATPLSVFLFHDASIAPVLRVFGFAVPAAVLTKIAVGYGRGLNESLPRVVLENFTLPLVRFAGVAIILAVGLSAVAVAWAYVIPYLIAAGISIIYLWRSTGSLAVTSSVPQVRRSLLWFSLPLVITGTMNQVLGYLDTFLLGYYMPTGHVGIYNVVYPLAQLLSASLSAIGFLVLPLLSELHAEGELGQMRRLYQVATKWTFMATLPIFLVFVLYPDVTIAATFGPEYTAGAPALAILAAGFFLHAVAGLNGNALISIGYTQVQAGVAVGVAVLNVVLNILLIPEFSFVGAAAATAVSFGVRNGAYSAYLYYKTGIQPFTAAMLRPAVIAGGLLVGLHLVVDGFVTPSPSVIVGLGVVFVCAYGVAILRFGGIQPEEVVLVQSIEERFGIDFGPVKAIALRLLP